MLAVHAKALLPPEHSILDRPLGSVVGGQRQFVFQVDPEVAPLPKLVFGRLATFLAVFGCLGRISNRSRSLTWIGLDRATNSPRLISARSH